MKVYIDKQIDIKDNTDYKARYVKNCQKLKGKTQTCSKFLEVCRQMNKQKER